MRGFRKARFHHPDTSKRRIPKPTAKAFDLVAKQITLREILARIPDIREIYRQTFNEPSKALNCSHFNTDRENSNLITFQVHDVPQFRDLIDLEQAVSNLREKHDFLKKWTVFYATKGQGQSITFCNIDPQKVVEFSAESFSENSYSFTRIFPRFFDTEIGENRLEIPDDLIGFKFDTLADYCEPVRGNLTPEIEDAYLIQQWENHFISEMSLYYLGMFLLSSLVRYRPHLWANAIARRSFPERPADDRILVLLSRFVEESLEVVPRATVLAINSPFEKLINNTEADAGV